MQVNSSYGNYNKNPHFNGKGESITNALNRLTPSARSRDIAVEASRTSGEVITKRDVRTQRGRRPSIDSVTKENETATTITPTPRTDSFKSVVSTSSEPTQQSINTGYQRPPTPPSSKKAGTRMLYPLTLQDGTILHLGPQNRRVVLELDNAPENKLTSLDLRSRTNASIDAATLRANANRGLESQQSTRRIVRRDSGTYQLS